MIDARVRIVDLEPDGFSWLNGRLSSRDRWGGEVSVLHDGTRVVSVAGPAGDAVAHGDAVGDPAALAASVADASGAELVTVIDRRVLDELSSSLVDLGRSCRSQGELLWRARELWNTHPGVVAVPAPEPSRWPAVEALLAAVPDDRWIVARARREGSPPMVLAGRVRDGLIVEVTSAEPPVEAVAALLETDAATIEQVIAADDPLAALLDALRDPATTHRGLEPLLGAGS